MSKKKLLIAGSILSTFLLSSNIFAGSDNWEILYKNKLPERQQKTGAKILKIGEEYEISPKVNTIVMGLAWNPVDSNTSLDYDLSLFPYYTPNGLLKMSKKKRLLQIVDYDNLMVNQADFPRDAIEHHGDDIKGQIKRSNGNNRVV
ncbi:MAG: hypothetical protein AB8G05_15080 [Oligoflexales bacterium]